MIKFLNLIKHLINCSNNLNECFNDLNLSDLESKYNGSDKEKTHNSDSSSKNIINYRVRKKRNFNESVKDVKDKTLPSLISNIKKLLKLE